MMKMLKSAMLASLPSLHGLQDTSVPETRVINAIIKYRTNYMFYILYILCIQKALVRSVGMEVRMSEKSSGGGGRSFKALPTCIFMLIKKKCGCNNASFHLIQHTATSVKFPCLEKCSAQPNRTLVGPTLCNAPGNNNNNNNTNTNTVIALAVIYLARYLTNKVEHTALYKIVFNVYTKLLYKYIYIIIYTNYIYNT